MKTSLIAQLANRFDRRQLEREVEEELRFHAELVSREYVEQGMSRAEAEVAAQKRLGDLVRIKNQCVEIRRRNRPLRRVLKLLSIVIALIGFVVRLSSRDVHVAHVGGTLIAIAVSGRLLLYARGLSPSSFLQRNETSSLSLFTDNSHAPVSP
jgi:hypothetical protein